jgi:hypothetical protein
VSIRGSLHFLDCRAFEFPSATTANGRQSTRITEQTQCGGDTRATEAKERGLRVEVVNYAEGVHAFDIDQDTDESRRIITQAIAFAKTHLRRQFPAGNE